MVTVLYDCMIQDQTQETLYYMSMRGEVVKACHGEGNILHSMNIRVGLLMYPLPHMVEDMRLCQVVSLEVLSFGTFVTQVQ